MSTSGWASGLAAAINGWNDAQTQNYNKQRQAQEDLLKQKEFDQRTKESDLRTEQQKLALEKAKRDQADDQARRDVMKPAVVVNPIDTIDYGDGKQISMAGTAPDVTASDARQFNRNNEAITPVDQIPAKATVASTPMTVNGVPYLDQAKGLTAAIKYNSQADQYSRYADVAAQQGDFTSANAARLAPYTQEAAMADAKRKQQWNQAVESGASQDQLSALYAKLFPEDAIKQSQKLQVLPPGSSLVSNGQVQLTAPALPPKENTTLAFQVQMEELKALRSSIKDEQHALTSDQFADTKSPAYQQKVMALKQKELRADRMAQSLIGGAQQAANPLNMPPLQKSAVDAQPAEPQQGATSNQRKTIQNPNDPTNNPAFIWQASAQESGWDAAALRQRISELQQNLSRTNDTLSRDTLKGWIQASTDALNNVSKMTPEQLALARSKQQQ